MKNLADYVEEISDDFQSTFSVVGDNVLANMLGPNDFETVADIINRYIPTSKVTFIKTNHIKDTYDIYLVSIEDDDNVTC